MRAAGSRLGRANVILDNLIAEGKAKPMIVVMPLGYGAPEIVIGPRADFDHAALRQKNFDRLYTGAVAGGDPASAVRVQRLNKRRIAPSPVCPWAGRRVC